MPRKLPARIADLAPFTDEQVAEVIHVALMRASHCGRVLDDRRRTFLRYVSTAVLEALSSDGVLALSKNDLVLVLLGTALAAQLGIEERETNDGK